MRVAELIERLARCPPDNFVMHMKDNGAIAEVVDVTTDTADDGVGTTYLELSSYMVLRID